jgi:hypothetical protein
MGPLGQVVLFAGGNTYRFPVEELRGKTPQPLGDTGIRIRLFEIRPRPWSVHLEVRRKDKPPRLLSLYADYPGANVQDHRGGVFGTYWLVPPEMPPGEEPGDPHAEAMRAGRRPRIDILLAHRRRGRLRRGGHEARRFRENHQPDCPSGP